MLEFVNNKLTKNSKTADDDTTVVVGSDKLLAVGPVSHASACADSLCSLGLKCQTLALLFQGVL